MKIKYAEMGKIIDHYNKTYIQPLRKFTKISLAMEQDPEGVEILENPNRRKYGIKIINSHNDPDSRLKAIVNKLPKSIKWEVNGEVINIPVNTSFEKRYIRKFHPYRAYRERY